MISTALISRLEHEANSKRYMLAQLLGLMNNSILHGAKLHRLRYRSVLLAITKRSQSIYTGPKTRITTNRFV